MSEFSFTDKDGDTFTASYIGEGLIKLKGTYAGKESETVDIDFLADDIERMIGILKQAEAESEKGVGDE